MSREERAAELSERLRHGLLICDGATGTMLSAGGHAAGESLDAYNVTRPDAVRAVHRAYREAGTTLITTNTFQASSISLARHGLAARAAEFNRAGAQLAREVAGEDLFVAGDIGPTGAILEPYGELPEAEARASFEEQAQALAAGGADMFILQTFTDLAEAKLAAAVAAAAGLPVAVSLAFDANGRTVFGATSRQAAEGLAEVGATVVGANCGTISPAEMVGILRQFREATDLPLIAQPNAGRPQRTESGTVFPEGPETVAESAPGFRELGATIIGGCCGTTPAHIAAIAARLKG
jgi:methionine synthase I (cobalamin-dependent)